MGETGEEEFLITDVTHGIYLYIAGRRRKASKADNSVQAAAQLGVAAASPLYELRSSSTRSGVAERCSLYRGLRFACTRL
jgi:hypothetical protein